MSVETHLHRARERVANEREAVTDKRDALDRFADRIRQQSPSGSPAEPSGRPTGGGVTASAVSGTTDELEAVRTAFAETVCAHTTHDSVLTALQRELGEEAALALAPTTNAAFTPQIKRELLSRTAARQHELAATLTALDGEASGLEDHQETVDDLVSWLTEADETPLSDLGFDRLRVRHDRLTEFRADCVACLDDRQAWLASTTSEGGQVGVTHRSLVESLYEDFPVEYPVLATVTRLVSVCEDAQETVRAHLVRRA